MRPIVWPLLYSHKRQQLLATVDAKLAIGVLRVTAHGVLGDGEVFRYIALTAAQTDELHDLDLSMRETAALPHFNTATRNIVERQGADLNTNVHWLRA